MKNRVFYSLIFVLIALMGIFLVFQNYRLKEELVYSKKILKFSSNSRTDLIHLNRILAKYVFSSLDDANFKWNLVIIFSPEDCPYCIQEISYWADFKEKEKNFGGWGLVNHPHGEMV